MKKKINIRNFIIAMLCITIIFMGIGFVFLSIKLDEQSKNAKMHNIVITKAEAKTAIQGGTLTPSAKKELINEGKTIKFNFILNNPKDELAYDITIKNTGNLPAKIIKLIATPDYINNQTSKSIIEPVTITQTQLENLVLDPGEKTIVKVIVTYNMSNTVKQVYIPYELTVLATNAN